MYTSPLMVSTSSLNPSFGTVAAFFSKNVLVVSSVNVALCLNIGAALNVLVAADQAAVVWLYAAIAVLVGLVVAPAIVFKSVNVKPVFYPA